MSAPDETDAFRPRFDASGLLTVVVEDADTAETLMVAHANAAAVEATLRTGVAHFWSRSRAELWRKGATSGNELLVRAVLVDCDQDALLYRVAAQGQGVACHTGRRSCFYRSLGAPGAAASSEESSSEASGPALRFVDGSGP